MMIEIGQMQIALRSYQIWEHEGRPDGRHVEHWLQAEAELKGEAASQDTHPSGRQRVATTKGKTSKARISKPSTRKR